MCVLDPLNGFRLLFSKIPHSDCVALPGCFHGRIKWRQLVPDIAGLKTDLLGNLELATWLGRAKFPRGGVIITSVV